MPSPLNKKPRVLAVDDTPANLVSMEAVLGDEYEMIRATSGEEGLRILRLGTDIDVILLDVQMPGIDGFETAQRIKKIESARDIPIIFVTAIYKEDPFVKKGYEVGGMDYFSKPFDPDILRAKVGIYASFRMKSALLHERERQVRASEELLRVGRKLASVLQNVPVGVLVTDMAGRILYDTQEVGRILGASGARSAHERALGWWGVDGQALADPASALARALHDGETSSGKLLELESGVNTRTVLVSVSPLRRPLGEVAGAVVLLQDVSEQRRAGDDLEAQVARIVADDAMWLRTDGPMITEASTPPR